MYFKDDECRDIVFKDRVANEAMIEEPHVEECEDEQR